MESKRIAIGKLTPNKGQIEGLPANPRQWTQTDIDRIARSLLETPELFEMRPCIVYPHGDKFVILGGNLRYTGAKANKDKDVPCIVMPEDTPVEKLREIVVKDNSSFGAWDYDALANEWDDLPLADWGVPAWEEDGPAPDEFGEDFKLPDGEKSDFCTMNFQVSTEQREIIQSALREIKETAEYAVMDTHGNNNTNGNALALIVEMYGKMQRNSD